MLDPNIVLSAKDLGAWSASGADGLTFEKQVIYVGKDFKKWEGSKVAYQFDVDEPTIDNWVAAFNDMQKEGIKVVVPKIHSFDPEDRRGEVIELSKKSDDKGRISLFAKIKFDKPEYAQLFNKSDVSLFSPPVLRHHDKTWVRPIQHIGLTDYPLISDLQGFTIAASNVGVKNMDFLKTICAALGLEVPADATEETLVTLITDKFKTLQEELDAAKTGASKEGEPNPDDNKEAIAASNNPLMLSLLADNRAMKVDKLVSERRITPAQAKSLKATYVEKVAPNDGFDGVYNLALSNEPIRGLEGTSATGSQSSSGTKKQKSAIVADAEARAGKK